MTIPEIRKLTNHEIRYKCSRSRRSLHDIWRGVIEEVTRSEIRISGDWIDKQGFEIIEDLGVVNE